MLGMLLMRPPFNCHRVSVIKHNAIKCARRFRGPLIPLIPVPVIHCADTCDTLKGEGTIRKGEEEEEEEEEEEGEEELT